MDCNGKSVRADNAGMPPKLRGKRRNNTFEAAQSPSASGLESGADGGGPSRPKFQRAPGASYNSISETTALEETQTDVVSCISPGQATDAQKPMPKYFCSVLNTAISDCIPMQTYSQPLSSSTLTESGGINQQQLLVLQHQQLQQIHQQQQQALQLQQQRQANYQQQQQKTFPTNLAPAATLNYDAAVREATENAAAANLRAKVSYRSSATPPFFHAPKSGTPKPNLSSVGPSVALTTNHGVCASWTPSGGVNLHDWKGSRVLARMPGRDCYFKATIKTVRDNNRDLGLTFDEDPSQTLIFFNDVLGVGSDSSSCPADVVADQAPTPDHVKLGDWVCARKNADQSAFELSQVVGVSLKPASFQVSLLQKIEYQIRRINKNKIK